MKKACACVCQCAINQHTIHLDSWSVVLFCSRPSGTLTSQMGQCRHRVSDQESSAPTASPRRPTVETRHVFSLLLCQPFLFVATRWQQNPKVIIVGMSGWLDYHYYSRNIYITKLLHVVKDRNFLPSSWNWEEIEIKLPVIVISSCLQQVKKCASIAVVCSYFL